MPFQNSVEREQELDKKWGGILQQGASTESFAKAYDEKHALFIEDERSFLDRVKLPDFYMPIVKQVGTGKKVLEIGPGHGMMSFTLARRGNVVVGVDISDVVLEKLRAKLKKEPELNLQFKQGDARHLDFEDETFDYAISTNLVEHFSMEDGRRHLQEMWRVLMPKGCYLFFVPSRIKAGYRSAGFHLYMYSLKEALALAASLRFKARWIEPSFRRLGITGEICPAVTSLFIQYERFLGILKKAFPKIQLQIAGYTITPTVMVAAHKIT